MSNWRFGWIDSNIPEWLEANEAALPRKARVVLSTIDSGRVVSSSPMLASALQREPETPGGPMSMTVDELLVLARDVFAGFEEVWFLRGKPETAFTDAPVRLDCSEEAAEPTPEFLDWLNAHGVLLGLGDGLGLAFVCHQDTECDRLRF